MIRYILDIIEDGLVDVVLDCERRLQARGVPKRVAEGIGIAMIWAAVLMVPVVLVVAALLMSE